MCRQIQFTINEVVGFIRGTQARWDLRKYQPATSRFRRIGRMAALARDLIRVWQAVCLDDTWILRAAERPPDLPRFLRWSSGGGRESSPRCSALKSRQIRRPFRYFFSEKIPEESRCLHIGVAALADKTGDHHRAHFLILIFSEHRTPAYAGGGARRIEVSSHPTQAACQTLVRTKKHDRVALRPRRVSYLLYLIGSRAIPVVRLYQPTR